MARVFDVSEYQPNDRVLDLINNKHAEGFILKFGETIHGEPELDPKFVMFVNQVVAAGLPYGIYYVSHAQNEDDFIMEANWINDQMYELLGGEFPQLGIWWDVEVDAVCRNDVWPQLRDTIGTMQSWYTADKDKIGIYSGYSYFNNYLDFNELAYYQIPIWVAQYGYSENSLKEEHPELNHVAWQYNDTYGDLSQDVNEWYQLGK